MTPGGWRGRRKDESGGGFGALASPASHGERHERCPGCSHDSDQWPERRHGRPHARCGPEPARPVSAHPRLSRRPFPPLLSSPPAPAARAQAASGLVICAQGSLRPSRVRMLTRRPGSAGSGSRLARNGWTSSSTRGRNSLSSTETPSSSMSSTTSSSPSPRMETPASSSCTRPGSSSGPSMTSSRRTLPSRSSSLTVSPCRPAPTLHGLLTTR